MEVLLGNIRCKQRNWAHTQSPHVPLLPCKVNFLTSGTRVGIICEKSCSQCTRATWAMHGDIFYSNSSSQWKPLGWFYINNSLLGIESQHLQPQIYIAIKLKHMELASQLLFPIIGHVNTFKTHYVYIYTHTHKYIMHHWNAPSSRGKSIGRNCNIFLIK